MDCNETRALLGADVDHELSAADAWRIARHVGGCGACRLERERLVALRRAMRQAEYHRAPGALRARIAAGLPLAAVPFAQAPVQDLPASDVPVSPVSDVPVSDVPVSDMPVSDVPVSDAPEQDTPSQDMRAPNKPAVDRPPEAKPRFGADARGGARAGRWFARPGSRGPTLDRPGPGPGPGPGPRAAALPGLGWGVALTVALAAAAGFALDARRAATEHAVDEIVASHVRAGLSSRDIDVISTDRHTVKPWFNGRLDFAPPVVDLSASGFALAGGRLDYVGQRRVAVLVYRYRQHVIDVYVWPSGEGGARPYATVSQGYALDRWEAAGMTWWAVTDAEPSALAAFRTALDARVAAPRTE
ncbi:transmembrane transcriptional regulator (anti-sigma factor) [Burkholderia pseudomallei]|uniref:anti-sigma factor family protein n=1 Tax=Burkholderia pseudomallei TaxID=28450 RepID=UPI000F04553B|nr:zf-HC2 domain-containing protein [Burkholderia pseudomallei]AYX28368.1 anti-sigma factor [Burkholderia pseudomallei]CAJ3048748.1 transmembrane transcriptional regulator (anti-sigma factor) [Burkholderia pseudomallei]CAJ3133691.1 transmembrane transcriptional regulator (anti-sigma factor) [Burkholderia pseudomallei]CAJ3144231.1 transmembrane transcriptional regulator (anti-sigma factor) [Burkholderia pseudomallei]VBC90079.1 transmembrane transcriptional regulator (anti-sigma factor) [Burkhol